MRASDCMFARLASKFTGHEISVPTSQYPGMFSLDAAYSTESTRVLFDFVAFRYRRQFIQPHRLCLVE